MSIPDHYHVLGLEKNRFDSNLTSSQIRKAYRKALLLNHPDRTASVTTLGPSVDEITAAMQTLADPQSRAHYDRELLTKNDVKPRSKHSLSVPLTGLEIVDLDDLCEDVESSTWTRSCRCGNPQGFVITQDDLEAHESTGELITGCRGCSLWLKVLYQPAPMESEEKLSTEHTSAVESDLKREQADGSVT